MTTSWDAHIEVACTCLTYVITRLPAQPLSGSIGVNIRKESLHNNLPFCNYAVVSWIAHLEATKRDNGCDTDANTKTQLLRLLLCLSDFLPNGLLIMSWLEASYIFGTSPSFKRLVQWSSWAKSLTGLYFSDDVRFLRLHDDISELSHYLPKLHEYWGSKLAVPPISLWEEVTAFTPCRLLPQSSSVKVHSLLAQELNNDYLSTQALCKISESTLDGLLVAVLSVWPER